MLNAASYRMQYMHTECSILRLNVSIYRTPLVSRFYSDLCTNQLIIKSCCTFHFSIDRNRTVHKISGVARVEQTVPTPKGAKCNCKGSQK